MQKTSDLIWQDTQHQALFELIDKIKEIPFDPDILIQLKLYAEHHFVLEETYMHALGYPHKDEHIEAHDRFREELAAMGNAGNRSNHGHGAADLAFRFSFQMAEAARARHRQAVRRLRHEIGLEVTTKQPAAS
jgi:hemerythrin-like metal-binding protein